jgi:hypothetical protein
MWGGVGLSGGDHRVVPFRGQPTEKARLFRDGRLRGAGCPELSHIQCDSAGESVQGRMIMKGREMNNGVSGSVYGMAVIGAAVYYIQHAATFWAGVLGIFKAIFWPAVLMYNLLAFLRM